MKRRPIRTSPSSFGTSPPTEGTILAKETTPSHHTIGSLAPTSGHFLQFVEAIDCLLLPTAILLLSTIEDGPLVAMSFVVNIPHIGRFHGVFFAWIVLFVGIKVAKLE